MNREMMIFTFKSYLLVTWMSLIGLGIVSGLLISTTLKPMSLYDIVRYEGALIIILVVYAYAMEHLLKYKIKVLGLK